MITAELDKSPIEIVSDISSEVEILNRDIVTGSDNQQEAIVEDLDNLEISVAKKEYAIVGDSVYIPQLYDDAPQWMKDLVGLVVDVSMTTNSTQLINDMNAMLQKFAVSYVPLNQYTQSILDLGNEDMRLNAFIETLNSNFNNGISNANAQIINLQMTKASKDEVLAQVIQTLAAQLADPNSNLGATVVRLDQAIATEQQARALSMSVLTSTINGVNDDVIANAEVVQNALAYVGIDEAGASTGTGLSGYLEASDGTIGGADSQLTNMVRVTAEGVESKWAYNSIVNINGVYRKSGFGLTASNFSGTGTQTNPYTSEFWIDATKLRFTNSAATGRTAPFTIDASGTTPEITFNGVVSFTNVTGLSTNISTSINSNNEYFAKQLGYANYSALTNAYSNGATIINGEVLNTGLIQSHSIAANKISTIGLIAENISSTTLTGKTINGSTINGAIINGATINASIINASYLDVSSDLTLVTDYVITNAMYVSSPSIYGDAVYISGTNTYRIPTVPSLSHSQTSETTLESYGSIVTAIRSYNCANARHNYKCVKASPIVTFSKVYANVVCSRSTGGYVPSPSITVQVGGYTLATVSMVIWTTSSGLDAIKRYGVYDVYLNGAIYKKGALSDFSDTLVINNVQFTISVTNVTLEVRVIDGTYTLSSFTNYNAPLVSVSVGAMDYWASYYFNVYGRIGSVSVKQTNI